MRATLPLAFLALLAPGPAKADDKKPDYEQFRKLAVDLGEKQLLTYSPAHIMLIPGDKADSAKFYGTRIIDALVQPRQSVDDEIVVAIVLSLVELHDHDRAFGDNKTLAKGGADRRELVKEMVDLLHSKRDEKEKAKKFAALQERFAEVGAEAFRKYCKERGYKVEPSGFETNLVTVTLVTSPDGGRICMLSAFEYELFKLRGKDPDAELAKSVIAKTDQVKLAGKYYYQVEWPGGKKSKVGITTIKEEGKYSLP